MDEFIAHSHADGRQHGLADHLGEVGRLAAQFSGDDATRSLARLAGLWHDLGKYRPGFQRYIRMVGAGASEDAHIEGKLPQGSDKSHSAAGALWALKQLGETHGADAQRELKAALDGGVPQGLLQASLGAAFKCVQVVSSCETYRTAVL
jgi:CRISPR-associated endonuclease/helicase Cas3